MNKCVMTSRLLAVALVTLAGLWTGGGCGVPPTQPVATNIDPREATPEFWWDKPALVRIPVSDFDRAFEAAQFAARDRLFVVDRVEARDGVITTRPLTAAQWFEPWRRDNTTAGDVLRASTDTYRRTVRFDFEKTPDGRYVVLPKVLVERQTLVGRRTTGVIGFRGFTAVDQSSLTAKTDDGQAPPTYWYAIARDHNLEIELGKSMLARMY